MIQAQSSGSNFAVEITSGENKLISDVEKKIGGENLGLDPHRLLEASLASCTIITLKMYANLKKIDLQDVQVVVNIETEGKQTMLSRKIKLIGNLPRPEREKLMEIAEKCPIHKLLLSEISIQTSGME